MRPHVSVLMAAKNYARFIPQAIESTLAQSVDDWELVIVDDGSTDATPQVVKPFLNDPRIRYFRSDSLGQSRAKNLCYRLSRGEYLAYLDADDAWAPAKLARQLELFAANPKLGVCSTGRWLMDEKGTIQESRDRKGVEQKPERSLAVAALSEIFLKNSICFSSVMVRRGVFESVGAFDPEFDLSIDYDLWLRVAPHFEFAAIDEPLVYYRTGHGNLSQKLCDRVGTAEAIKARCIRRNELPSGVIREGYSSTFNSLAYVLRKSEPRESLRWSARALAWGGQKIISLKGIAAACLQLVFGQRELGSAENRVCNR